MSERREVEFGQIPKSWDVTTIGECTEIVTDYVANGSFASLKENVNYLDAEGFAWLVRLRDYHNNFGGDRVWIDKHAYHFLSKSKLFGGEVIVSNVGQPGVVFRAPSRDNFPMSLGPNSIMMRFLESDSFYFYWLKSPFGQFMMDGIIGGSAQQKFNKTSFKQIECPRPPIEEQEAIAEVLSSLDDKIDLLKRQNKTLEGMAEALFRQWFIEEAQDDWEEVPLGEVFDFTMGQSPPGSSFNEEGVGMPMYQGNADFGMRFPSARVYTTEPKRIAGPGEVLMSVRAPVGAMNMAQEKCCIGRGVAAFRFNEESSFDTYTFYKIKAMISEFMVFNDQGTVFGSIGKQDLHQIMIVLPPFNLIEKFEAEVGPLDYKIRANANEIDLLERKRDTLLPKLMSGEVRVNLD